MLRGNSEANVRHTMENSSPRVIKIYQNGVPFKKLASRQCRHFWVCY